MKGKDMTTEERLDRFEKEMEARFAEIERRLDGIDYVIRKQRNTLASQVKINNQITEALKLLQDRTVFV